MNPFDPMPTIRAILGMTMAQDITESVLLAELDDFEVPRCEVGSHDTDAARHSGPAAYMLTAPCSHGKGYICAAFADWLLTLKKPYCMTCGHVCKPSDLNLYPIGGNK